ncbi:hypothetical protein OG427_26990 [Streptomyces sp. NBC_00133]
MRDRGLPEVGLRRPGLDARAEAVGPGRLGRRGGRPVAGHRGGHRGDSRAWGRGGVEVPPP